MDKTTAIEVTAAQANALLELAKILVAGYLESQEDDFRRFMQIMTDIKGPPDNALQEAKRAILATRFILLHGKPTRAKVEEFIGK